MLNDIVDDLGLYSDAELRQWMETVRAELKRRVKNDSVVYVVRRNPRNESETVRYHTTRSCAGVGFEATSLDDYNVVAYESKRWAEFVAECTNKKQSGRATYDVIEIAKEKYYTLPCYQKVQVARLRTLRDHFDEDIARKAGEFLGEIDCFNSGYGGDPRFLIKDWLERLEK